ncbi:VWA domain-containing protein [Cryobacterium sinapicolor]|uniref:VWA domain-containing protein n=1 Tax=Cryobacterium sinapicolor TaxID=1259236 RepID=A0ABY2IUK3_9MICO|nr:MULTISPECIES: vWA domain-containing protein [Cryobacterium]TFC93175.1 VWA domain-containing protein [Cryobacterium sp. TMT3-29-2]TFC94286.1 VWA domain-containing protein [Cryobacterium sinapicolor]
MTDPNYTALLLVIDRSGSMSSIRDDMVGGLTAMLAEQAAEPGLLTVDVVTFDDEIEHTHTLAAPNEITIELDPRGMTALHDAIGIAVTGFGETLRVLPEHARPGTVQVVVVTDGGENSSSEYSAAAVRALINRQTETYSWDFVFLGANQDAVLTGATLGFDAASSMTFAAAPGEVAAMSANLGRYVTDVRKKDKRGFTVEERAEAGGEAV